ncbi:hydroxyacid dehydrogenase [Chelativorans sp. M5D2P16]|uniref:hydroxyacid dehydrogenase n=1 Tax=Chelativorans sp. M5D2P16 TaxID=3095678 RepID=UPI002ACA363B|nr:hydroxyacid dehydrogenase [Chelativorans sp. M5D2P16]MDZ5699816.1 hydroxyacid dehydrogenase [Chelativorans sp. M5D2P16]
MPVIFSTHSLHPHAVRVLEQVGEFVVASAPDQETLQREGREADVIIVRAPLPTALFDDPPRLRAAIRHGAGLDMIPVEAATEAGVLVANVPAVNARTVAEHVMMVTLALQRRFRIVDRDLRQAGWTAARAHADLGHDLAGRTMGIVGMGAVGRAVFETARSGFGLNVITATRSSTALPEGVLRVDLDTLVARSDVIVLCCPLTAETRGLINRGRIRRMKPEVLLINVSRGPVVDEAALLTALQKGTIAGAALDVFSTQPLPVDHPLLALDNVILTPHMAGITEDSMMRMGTGAAEEAVRVLSGELPRNFCNPQAEARYRLRFPSGG